VWIGVTDRHLMTRPCEISRNLDIPGGLVNRRCRTRSFPGRGRCDAVLWRAA
jgi:hypothetical protein